MVIKKKEEEGEEKDSIPGCLSIDSTCFLMKHTKLCLVIYVSHVLTRSSHMISLLCLVLNSLSLQTHISFVTSMFCISDELRFINLIRLNLSITIHFCSIRVFYY